MAAKTPSVSNDRLYDPAQPGASIRLDTPAWAAWLDAPTTTSFSYPLYNHTRGYIEGVMTVRKERRARGGAYWSAYRRYHGTLRRVYLGRSPCVTHARLQAIAEAWCAESVSPGEAAPVVPLTPSSPQP
jgi:LuxR family maltose regulon positive regulatory protein